MVILFIQKYFIFYLYKMHYTISNINKTGELRQYIDSRDGNKLVGVKSFT